MVHPLFFARLQRGQLGVVSMGSAGRLTREVRVNRSCPRLFDMRVRLRRREVFMPVSTRSLSPALVLVLTAILFLAATDARGQSQYVTVTFQGHVTSVFQSDLGSLPASVSVGNP